MNKKNNNKGFTLAELLIVVAIIAVLVAIAIPVFTAQLEKSREATDLANIRSGYAEIVVKAIEDDQTKEKKEVKLKQTVEGWATADADATLKSITGSDNAVTGTPKSGKKATIEWVGGTASAPGHAKITFES